MAYKSKYEEQLANALNNLTNREKFSYDFNADPMYQQYKDQYTKLGNEAAANAAANVAALTGGYGNSYAATAAAQANQQYLTKLNEMIPSLQQQALNKYMMEGDELNNVYSTLSDADSRDYSKYRDEVADQQWQQNFEEQIRQYNQNYAYNQARDAIADKQWQAQFDENNRRYNQEWTASQAAQAAAQALKASQTSNNSSGNTNSALAGVLSGAVIGANIANTNSSKLSSDAQKNIKSIESSVARKTSNSSSADEANKAISSYLTGLVNSDRITKSDAEILYKQYMK